MILSRLNLAENLKVLDFFYKFELPALRRSFI